jgi:microcystin-dependent protein
MPYISEIRLLAFGKVPSGWAPCDGRQMTVQDNQQLFALLGTTYGGDGLKYFNLPDLRGRVPLNAGGQFRLGQTGGEGQHTLTVAEMAAHAHAMMAYNGNASAGGEGVKPGAATALAQAHPVSDTSAAIAIYGPPPAGPDAMAANALMLNDGGQAHENRQPYLVLNFCMALQGEFPNRA